MSTYRFNSNDYHFCTLNETQLTKSLPPLNFVQKLIDICQTPIILFDSQQRNKYDRKNHILYINNFVAYERILKEKYGRSVGSFQKQLKMMGFKRRKVREHNVMQEIESNNLQSPQHYQTAQKSNKYPKQTSAKSQKYMLVWKTNRPRLIEQQMEGLQHALQEEIERAMRMREDVEKKRKELDRRLECVLLSELVGWLTQYEGDMSMAEEVEGQSRIKPIKSQFSSVIQQLRLLTNSTKQSATSLIKQISKISQSQLQLYRALIYKEPPIHRDYQRQ